MPELPEVETTARGIRPHVVGRRVVRVVVREPRLRWPVPPELADVLPGQVIRSVLRRAKYLLLRADAGTLVVHLGMSGSLRIVRADLPPRLHDHVDVVLDDGRCLRLCDPRRFGTVLWTTGDPLDLPLLAHLGPEPLADAFDGAYLHAVARRRSASIKTLLMDGEVVVGVGNIYASEALFRAGIHPHRAAGRIARARLDRLARAVKEVLRDAIRRGGTTLQDFTEPDGTPGRFGARLRVYDRAGAPCRSCAAPIVLTRVGQRSTYHCPRCQR